MLGAYANSCCCDSVPTSCCDWWACPENAASITNITVTNTYKTTRYYDTGESIETVNGSWTVQSVGLFTRQGANCTVGLFDGCPQATVTWDVVINSPAFLHTGTGSTLDGVTETAHVLCAGCLYPGPSCKYDGTLCATRIEHYYGSQTVTGAPNAMRYECHSTCPSTIPISSCVRPMVSYTPESIDIFLLGLYTRTDPPACCAPGLPDTGPDPAYFGIGGFSVGGKCGCPAIDTWDNPMSLVFGFGSGPGQCSGQPYNNCIQACNCEYINSADIKIASGADVFTWQCEDYYPDPFNPSIVQCERVIKWYDICEHLFTVSVS